MLFEFTAYFFSALALGALSIVLWIIFKKKKQKIWFPITKIIENKNQVVQNISFKKPPLIPFLCFLSTLLAIVFFATKPTKITFAYNPKDVKRIHIFCDMSPSVSGFISLENYAKKAEEIYQNISSDNEVSFSTSHSPSIFRFKNPSEVKEMILQLGFHPSGTLIGTTLKKQLNLDIKLNALVILSDKDQHSWSDVNLEYFSEQTHVFFLDLSENKTSIANAYFESAKYLEDTGSNQSDWEVTLKRVGPLDEKNFTLKAVYENTTLLEQNFVWEKNSPQTVQKVSFDDKKIKSDHFDESKPIQWQLVIDGDPLTADNNFFSYADGFKKSVLLIANPEGESTLEDPAYQLKTSLEILGFRVLRFDWLNPKNKDYWNIPLWISFVDETDLNRTCPKELSTEPSDETKKRPNVWLMPENEQGNFSNLCYCYHELAVKKEGSLSDPIFCKEATTRELFNQTMIALGSFQLGGSLNNFESSIAWSSSGSKDLNNWHVLAFNIPLQPKKSLGINHAMIPILVKQILVQEKLLSSTNLLTSDSIPRILDQTLSSTWDEKSPNRIENIPAQESIFAFTKEANLPKAFTKENIPSLNQELSSEKKEDPMFWIIILTLLIAFSLLVEIVFYFLGKKSNVSKIVSKKVSKTVSKEGIIILLTLAASYKNARSEDIYILSSNTINRNLQRVSKELAARTSTEISSNPAVVQKLSDEAFSFPLIWATDQQYLIENQKVDQRLFDWISRGGFLVIENIKNPAQLNPLFNQGLLKQDHQAHWQTVSLDHELMKSFYLIPDLPQCSDSSWNVLTLDKRAAVFTIPGPFLESIEDTPPAITSPCFQTISFEIKSRIFTNLWMMLLTTDYKKDQIHINNRLNRNK